MHLVKKFCFVAAIAGGGALVFTARAMAQDAEDAEATAGDETAGETASGESSAATDEAPPAPPEEKPGAGEASAALGLRYRGVLLPKPVMGWFVEGGKTVYV